MPVSFSFGGAGYQFPFMLGVAHGLKTHFNLNWNQVIAHGNSSGCAGALALLLCTPAEIDQLVLSGVTAAHSRYPQGVECYFTNLIKSMLPTEAATRVQERLVVGQSRLPFFRSRLVTGPFADQAELIDQVYGSCRIPFITGSFNEILDGGFSHQYAVVDQNTIVITLKHKTRSDLSATHNPFFSEIVLPSPEYMMQLYEHGKKVVADNLPALERKIRLGSQGSQFRAVKYSLQKP